MREKLVTAILDLTGDEFMCDLDFITLAKESTSQLVDRLIDAANWYKDRYNES